MHVFSQVLHIWKFEIELEALLSNHSHLLLAARQLHWSSWGFSVLLEGRLPFSLISAKLVKNFKST